MHQSMEAQLLSFIDPRVITIITRSVKRSVSDLLILETASAEERTLKTYTYCLTNIVHSA